MRLSDFDYPLPESLIAYEPPQERTSAKLLYVSRSGFTRRVTCPHPNPLPEGKGKVRGIGKPYEISHHVFRDIGDFFKSGDVLVLNNTKVVPARLLGKRKSGGKVEALLLKSQGMGIWEALVRPSGRVKRGEVLEFGDNGIRLRATVSDTPGQCQAGGRILEFSDPEISEKLDQIGHIPLPPYIKRPDHEGDRRNYQTVFAEKKGAVAAPTAGLHFDRVLLKKLKDQGIEIVFVTLHVSYGTFQPITVEDLSRHQIFEEEYEIPEASAKAINRALSENRRVIACGTTTVRALESAAALHEGTLQPHTGVTELFIYPPYEFRIVRGLITNFHLPKSSLLCLVAAFLGDRKKLFSAYEEAMRCGYRFYSYGDAMLIL